MAYEAGESPSQEILPTDADGMPDSIQRWMQTAAACGRFASDDPVVGPVEATPPEPEVPEQMKGWLEQFIREGWLSWQKAMAGGWVEDWMDTMCDDSVVLCDRFTRAKPIIGKESICAYYNKLIHKTWGKGCVMTWQTNLIRTTGPDTILCDYDINYQHPSGHTLTRRHGDVFTVRDSKIVSIVFNPLPPRKKGSHKRESGLTIVVEKEVHSAPPVWERLHRSCPYSLLPNHPQELMTHALQAWQRAMDGGWVHEWASVFCTDDVQFQDLYLKTQGIVQQVEVPEGLARYYNKLLRLKWGNNAVVQWRPRHFFEVTPTQVVADHMITCKNALGVVTSTQCFFSFDIQGSRLSEIRIYQKDATLDEVIRHVWVNRPIPRNPRSPSERALLRGASSGCLPRLLASSFDSEAMSTAAASSESGDDRVPHVDAVSQAGSTQSGGSGGVAHALVEPSEAAPSEAPSDKDRIVQLARPCVHNSWDNVRIKRGWLVLRCRLCHGQWRQRPTEIKRCAAFAEGQCDLDMACSELHVHHIKHTKAQREQVKVGAEQIREFLATPPGLACVGALAILRAVVADVSQPALRRRLNRRTRTCPPLRCV
eukprot:TRINITY_DN26079_c4_g1_i2.p1 TRINITY_DN26079_c4_g1~~TRINITY_DN26079_c4_g1_i2.p1  ORF type:complete len:596 (+),score=176.69 TRINITY_DN26079_c4_g1_i2:296-2083(+)